MKQTVLWLLLPILTISLLMGCGASQYQYIDGDGCDYIVLPEDKMNPTDVGMDGVDIQAHISAESLEAMIHKIQTGAFSERDYYFLARWRDKDAQGRIILPDLNNLLLVIPPDNLQWQGVNIWDSGVGGDYSFYCDLSTEENTFFIRAAILSAEQRGPGFYDSLEDTATAVITESSTEEEIATVRRAISADFLQGVFYRYQIQWGSVVYYATDWCYDDASNGIEHILSRELEDGYFLEITVRSSQEVSIEWLTSFGVEPYEG